MDHNSDLSIVIVSYKSKDYLHDCLQSVEQSELGNTTIEICVVDNVSDDGSVEMVRDEFPHVNLIENSENKGFGAASNQGVQLTSGKLLLFLNPDVTLHKDALRHLVQFMNEKHDAAGATGRIANPDGSFQRGTIRTFPDLLTEICRLTVPERLHIGARRVRRSLFDEPQGIVEVEHACAAFLLIRREVFESMEGFDERFFLSFEDIDLCYRLKQSGHEIYYVPHAEAIHHVGKSTQHDPSCAVVESYRGMFHYFRKHSVYSSLSLIILWLCLLADRSFSIVWFSMQALLGSKEARKWLSVSRAVFSNLGLIWRGRDRLRVLFFVGGPRGVKDSPADFLRVFQYVPFFERAGIRCDLAPAKPSKYSGYSGSVENCFLRKCLSLAVHLRRVCCRLLDILRVPFYDVVFIQRFLVTINTSFLERCIAILNRHIVFDFDDSIFYLPIQEAYSAGVRRRRMKKFCAVMRLSRHVIAGNNYLAEVARQSASHVTVVPTVADTDWYEPNNFEDKSAEEIVIGWNGSPCNFFQLKLLENVLVRLCETYPRVIIKVSSHDLDQLRLDSRIRLRTKEWSCEDEIEDLKTYDIGVMPLDRSDYSRGKCAGKALVYMAAAIPTVSTNFGAICDIITDGEEGFVADSDDEWFDKLSSLVEDANMRREMGEKGRRLVEAKYSVKSRGPELLAAIEEVAAQ